MRELVIDLPIRLRSEPNERDHWAKKGARTGAHRGQAMIVVSSRLHTTHRALRLPVVVRFVYQGPRRLDDDNLRGACKAVRDGVADAFKVDDSKDSRIRWQYEQETPKPYGLRIEVTSQAKPQATSVRVLEALSVGDLVHLGLDGQARRPGPGRPANARLVPIEQTPRANSVGGYVSYGTQKKTPDRRRTEKSSRPGQ